MLREIINDDPKFLTFLRALNQNFYHQNIYSRQLEEFCSDYFKKDLSNYFDQYLRFPSIPVLEYSITKNKLKYRLIADVKGLEVPIKLGSADKWITATMDWKEVQLRKNEMAKPFSIDPNFLLDLRRVN